MSKLKISEENKIGLQQRIDELPREFIEVTGFRIAEDSENNCSKCLHCRQENCKFGPGSYWCGKHKEIEHISTLYADEDIYPNSAYVCNDLRKE